MVRRSTPQKKTDELAFPVRVRFEVPGLGFGNRLNDLHQWLSKEIGPGNYAVHSSNGLATDGMAVHLRLAEDAHTVTQAFPDFVLADGVASVAYSSPYKRVEEEPDMCGRFTLHHTWAEVHAALSLIPDAEAGRNTPARYNITPTQDVLFLAQDKDGEIVLKEGRWWLVPVWAKELPKYPLFNARSETAHEKSSFKASFASKRCLIPADGFYEWTKGEDGGKDPHYIHLPDQQPFAFAGLWAVNKQIDNETIVSCTILTAEPDPAIADIHDRMPIILQDDVQTDWLNPNTSVDDARKLLKHHRGGELQHYRVDRAVNSNRATGPELVEPTLKQIQPG